MLGGVLGSRLQVDITCVRRQICRCGYYVRMPGTVLIVHHSATAHILTRLETAFGDTPSTPRTLGPSTLGTIFALVTLHSIFPR
jgi:hypothetical protein